jgi:transcription elongation factor Elf1
VFAGLEGVVDGGGHLLLLGAELEAGEALGDGAGGGEEVVDDKRHGETLTEFAGEATDHPIEETVGVETVLPSAKQGKYNGGITSENEEMIEFAFVLVTKHLMPWFLKRINKPTPCVMECPTCGNLAMGSRMNRDYLFAAEIKFRKNHDGDVMICGTCGDDFDFNAFQAGADGVYHMRMWDCPQCKTSQPVTTYRCSNCGYRRE